MDNEDLVFQLLLETNVTGTAQQISASFKEVQSSAQSAATSVETMGTASEAAVARTVTATKQEAAAIEAVNKQLQAQVEQEARIDQILADMQARRAQGVPVAQSGASVPYTGAGADVAARFNEQPVRGPDQSPPEGMPIDWGGLKPSDIGQQAEQATLGIRGMRVEMMAFSAAAMLSLNEVQGALGKDAQASTAVKIAMEGARVAASMMMLSIMNLGPELMVATGGLMAVAAALPIVIELIHQHNTAVEADIKTHDAFIQSIHGFVAATAAEAQQIQDLTNHYAELTRVQQENERAHGRTPGAPDPSVAKELVQTKAELAAITDASTQSSNAIENLRDKESELRDTTDSATAAAHAQIAAMQYQAAAAEQVAKSIGDTRREAINDTSTNMYTTALAQAQGIQKRFEDGTISLGNAVAALGGIVGLTGAQIQTYRQQLLDAAIASNDLQTSTLGLNEDYHANSLATTAAGQAANAASVQTDAWNASQERLKTQLADTSAYTAATAAAKAYESVIASIAQTIITPTSVTAQDMLDTKAGTYVDKWDEYARKLETIKKVGAASDWAKLIPTDVLAKGTAAIEAWAAAEESAFYNGERLNKIDYSALKTSADTIIDGILGKFQLLQASEAAVKSELENMQKTDPSKYQEFLKAENLAPSASVVDATKAAFGAVGKAVDPATKAVGDYSGLVKGIPAVVTTKATWDDKGARADILAFEKFLDDFVSHYGGVDVNVNANLHAPVAPGSTGSGIPKYEGGGAGVFAQDQLIYVHANEGYWFSGTGWDVPPPISPRGAAGGMSLSGSSGMGGGVVLNIQNVNVGSGSARDSANEFLNAVQAELANRWGQQGMLDGVQRH